jgi:dephospho-CoA kinase
MRPGDPAYRAIVEAFGPAILTAPDGPIDRAALGRIVFADQAKLRQLERIVHPATRARIEHWLDGEETRAASADVRAVTVVDAVKLIENGYPAICDAVWVVVCDEQEQVRRLVESRGMLPADARQRIAAQPPQAVKVAAADVVIDNSGTLAETEAQVEAAWRAIQGAR